MEAGKFDSFVGRTPTSSIARKATSAPTGESHHASVTTAFESPKEKLQSESHPNHSNDPSSALREAVKFNAGVDRAAANQHRFQVRRDRRLRVQRFVIKFTTLRFGVAVEERVSGFSVARDVVLRENQNARIGSRRPSADWC